MKMKFSIFLYLLPFSLSVPPPPYPLFIVHPYLFQLKSISPLFNIIGYGIHIWKIPPSGKMERNRSESSNSSKSFDRRENENYLSNKLSIYWPKPPELIGYIPLHLLYVTNVELSSTEAYILLKVNEDHTCQISYWMGKMSKLPKRRITARFVVRLIYDLNTQIIGVTLNYISREHEHLESAEFQMIFNLGSGNIIPKLYRLAGPTNDLIKAVPLNYNELNGIDTFVLDEATHIKIWSASLNERKRRTALALVNYINTNDRLDITRNNKIQIGSELTDIDFLTFQREFVFHLRDKPPTLQFPAYSPDAPNEQVQEERNLKLFQYSIYVDRVYSEEILERPLTLEHLKPNKTQIMIDYDVLCIFIIIGLEGHAAIMEDAMADAEQYYWEIPKLKWKKIIIIRSTDPYPTPFIVNFNEFKSILNNYVTM